MPRATSLRLDDHLYDEATEVARSRQMSLNALVRKALEREVAEHLEQEMYRAAALLGQDADNDVEFAIPAQSEIAAGN